MSSQSIPGQIARLATSGSLTGDRRQNGSFAKGKAIKKSQHYWSSQYFRDAVRKALGEKVSVFSLEPRVILEIREIDCVTDVGEVEFPTADKMKMRFTPENTTGQRVAIIDLTKMDAKLMLDKGKVKVGWVACKFRKRADPTDASVPRFRP